MRPHLVVKVDPAHHHEDDVDHDVILECLVDPDGIGLFGGEAGAAKHLKHVAGVIGTDEKIDVVRPARASHEG